MNDWIALEEVSFVRSGRLILDRINWNISPGDNWVVLGANGSGKTTLLRLLAGYLWPTRGKITVLGEKFGRTDLRELRKKIGWVGSFLEAQIPSSQKPIDLIVSGKFASIGIFDKPDELDYARANELARWLNCEKILDSSYGVLSQGEKQRLLIARAMIHHPQLLILDEPCSGLDLVSREQLLRTLEQLSKVPEAPVMVLVTHHLEEITPAFGQVLLLKSGRQIASGRKEDLLKSELLSDLFGIPIEVLDDGGRYWTKIHLSE